jgi:hypothetical protein
MAKNTPKVMTRASPPGLFSRNYLRFVRALPCRVCGDTPSHAHHLIDTSLSRGMGLKVKDIFVIPLCSLHHNTIHDIGTETFEQNYGISQAAECLRTIEQALFEGVLTVSS